MNPDLHATNFKVKWAALFFMLMLSFSLLSCYQHYFRTHTQNKADADMLERLRSSNKIFLVHYQNGIVALQNVSIKNNTLTADTSLLDQLHLKYANPETGRTNRVKKTDKPGTLMEVHLYTNDAKPATGNISIPVSSINRVDVYELDKGATTTNHVLSTVGVVLVTAVVVTAIAVAIACNCPQVYVDNNGSYEFNGGMYSGAVFSSLERKDYMPLTGLQPVNDQLKIKIGNAPNEEQFINSVQLLKVDHAAGSNVLADRHGNIFAWSGAEAPVAAIAGKEDLKQQLLQVDGDQYAFDNGSTNKGPATIDLTFNKPANSTKARLILHGNNSQWSGYIYKKFNSLFGEGIDKWRAKEDKADPAMMEKWQRDQSLPLMVYLEQEKQWNFVDHFAMTGNTASRDMIMEIDLSKVTGDVVKIKLETTYRFWDLDYAAIDFSGGRLQSQVYIDPFNASVNTNDQRQALLTKDKSYTQLSGNDEINLQFNIPSSAKNLKSTYFLVCSGYYHSLEQFEGKQKLGELMKFKKAGAFNAFSQKTYFHLNDELSKLVIKQ